MATLPPWHALKSRTPHSPDQEVISEEVSWACPPLLNLEKHVRFYRDLLRSTEKVELTLSHSGKKEVTIGGDSPLEPSKLSNDATAKHEVVLVTIKTDLDPRIGFVMGDGTVDTRPEYKDPKYLTELVTRRDQLTTPAGSKNASPVGSPKNRVSTPSVPVGFKPPPPPGSRPPPPPKAPPPEKRIRREL